MQISYIGRVGIGNTAFNRAKKRFRKGFIQINFEG